MSLLEVRDLKKHFPSSQGCSSAPPARSTRRRRVVLDRRRRDARLVGESGCGKSTTGRVLLRLLPATAGQVSFDGLDVMAASRSTLQRLRRDMQIVFQDPYACLNPRRTVKNIIAEPLRIHDIGTEAEPSAACSNCSRPSV